jgi:peptidoglycan hydrolase-like protein with peptidoglycan-binding domain
MGGPYTPHIDPRAGVLPDGTPVIGGYNQLENSVRQHQGEGTFTGPNAGGNLSREDLARSLGKSPDSGEVMRALSTTYIDPQVEAPILAPVRSGTATLGPGKTNDPEAVKAVQRRLQAFGYSVAESGVWDAPTEEAVAKIQEQEEIASRSRNHRIVQIGEPEFVTFSNKGTVDAQTMEVLDRSNDGPVRSPLQYMAAYNLAISPGSRSPAVLELKKVLSKFDEGTGLEITGENADLFDEQTKAALLAFQRNNGSAENTTLTAQDIVALDRRSTGSRVGIGVLRVLNGQFGEIIQEEVGIWRGRRNAGKKGE